jgi:hypothetical protein
MADQKVAMETLPQQYQETLIAMQASMTLQWLDPTTLAPNDLNWKKHPSAQRRALSEFMGELEEKTKTENRPGLPWVGAALFNKRTGRLLDGHMRQTEAIERGDTFMPVLVIDVDEVTENLILRYLDEIGAMYKHDDEAQALLEQQLQVESDVLRALLSEGEAEGEEEEEEGDGDKPLKRSEMPAGGLALPLGAKYDYVVLLFKSEVDWNAAQDHFGLQRQQCPFSNNVGLGRVVDGAKYLHRVRMQNSGTPLEDADEVNDLLASKS